MTYVTSDKFIIHTISGSVHRIIDVPSDPLIQKKRHEFFLITYPLVEGPRRTFNILEDR